jgi:hypothetical protein
LVHSAPIRLAAPCGSGGSWGYLVSWDFTSPTGVALIAALGSFAAGLLGPTITAWTAKTTHSQRLAAEEKLAERRFEFDKELSQHKSDADIALAEKKFQLDARLADRKRRQDLAEEVLESFYKIRDVVRDVRVPLILPDEAASREPIEPESEAIASQRNRYYVPLARLEKHRSEIAAFLAKRYRTAAWFDPAADEPFQDVHQILSDIGLASQMLMSARDLDRRSDPNLYRKFEGVIWASSQSDPIAAKVEEAVLRIERVLRPALEGQSV